MISAAEGFLKGLVAAARHCTPLSDSRTWFQLSEALQLGPVVQGAAQTDHKGLESKDLDASFTVDLLHYIRLGLLEDLLAGNRGKWTATM